jgi:RNA polymerase sigma-70 factor, ECF subfamily
MSVGCTYRPVFFTCRSDAVWQRRRCATAGRLQPFRASGVLGLNEHTSVQTPPTEPARSAEFTTFMRAYQDMVFSTATRLVGHDAQAEDIAQEVFVRAYAHFDQLRTSPTSGGWLKTVATNLALNHLRRYRARWRRDEQDCAEWEVPVPDTLLADLGTQQHRTRIEEALRKLPVDQRTALVLYHFEDLSYQEISARLGASLAKIKTDIRRARLALLPLLQSSGIGRSSLED